MKAKTELIKELRDIKKELSLIWKRQDIIMKVLIPEVRPTGREMRIIKAKKKFVDEKEWRKVLR